jgi:hypothetical protein
MASPDFYLHAIDQLKQGNDEAMTKAYNLIELFAYGTYPDFTCRCHYQI